MIKGEIMNKGKIMRQIKMSEYKIQSYYEKTFSSLQLMS